MPAEPTRPSRPTTPAGATGPLTSDSIFRTIEDLVGLAPRATGTPGGVRAADYVATRLRDAGVPDVRIMTVPSYAWRADRCALAVDGHHVACSPIQHSATASDDQTGPIVTAPVTGRVVDIGAGRVPADARGAIVLFDLVFEVPLRRMLWLAEYRYDPHGAYRRSAVLDSRNPFQTSMTRVMTAAAKAGAVGAIGVLRDYPESVNYRNEYFADEPMAIPGVWITRSAGEQIRHRLRSASTASIDMLIHRDPVVSRSVIGILPGRSTDAVMIQSHHDSVTPGAVEDASGTAEVIALAEEFAARRDGATRDKTLMFVTFDTHFTGYHAHRRFIHDYVLNPRREVDIVLNATIEHVGLRATRGAAGEFVTTGESEPRGLFENLNLAWKWRLARMLRAHEMAGTALLFGTPFEFTEEGIPTDAAYVMSAGIPTLSLIAGPLYLYDDQDTLDKVDRDQLARVAGFFADVIDRVDSASPEWIGLIPRPLRRILPRRSWVTDPLPHRLPAPSDHTGAAMSDTITGRWDIEWASALGTEHIRLELVADGATITGVAHDDVGEYRLENGVIDGDTATGSFRMTKPIPLTVTFEVRIRGDAMTGRAKAGILPAAPVTGQRLTSG